MPISAAEASHRRGFGAACIESIYRNRGVRIMIITGLCLAAVAGIIHVYIFWLESIAWTTPRTRRIFGTTPEQAETTRPLAFNQGFYNLFLAVVAIAGIVVWGMGAAVVGITLALAGTGTMLAAALVLLLTSADKRRAAIAQGLVPLLAVLALVIGLAARAT